MKVSIVRGGGVAGVSTLTELNDSVLSADDAKAFRAKIGEAESGLAAAGLRPTGGGPDELQYEVAMSDDQTTRTVRAGETGLPESLRSLIAWVDTHPERTTRVLPPGAAP